MTEWIFVTLDHILNHACWVSQVDTTQSVGTVVVIKLALIYEHYGFVQLSLNSLHSLFFRCFKICCFRSSARDINRGKPSASNFSGTNLVPIWVQTPWVKWKCANLEPHYFESTLKRDYGLFKNRSVYKRLRRDNESLTDVLFLERQPSSDGKTIKPWIRKPLSKKKCRCPSLNIRVL